MTGIVFDIQHYCVHDGPGIRTDVFLKGCPLRCRWCANPESNATHPQLMFIADRCVGCGACVAVCPKEAISLQDGKAVTDRSLCDGCGACVKVCPVKARDISGKAMTVDEVITEVKLDAFFYGEDGGVTLSGGECLMQPDFAIEILRRCKEERIGTAIETCGFVPFHVFERAAPYLDIVLYDVKHMNSAAHKHWTGVPNELILENLHRLSAELGIPVIARTPLLPGVNDSAENLHAMGKFLSEQVPTLREVNLLPYHRLGEGKWEQLEDTTHQEVDTHVPETEELQPLLEILRGYGITAK